MQTLLINIKELLQVRESTLEKVCGSEMASLPTIKNAFLLINNDVIEDFGPMHDCPKLEYDITIDSDFDKSIIDRIKYYDNYIIIQIDSNYVYINNEKNNISEFSNNFRNILALFFHK